MKRPHNNHTFHYGACHFEPKSGLLRLHYAIDDQHRFEEKILLGSPSRELIPDELEAFDRLCKLLHLLAGVSYYKSFVPGKIDTGSNRLDEYTATVIDQIFYEGLGEFSYRNNLDLEGHIKFPSATDIQPSKLQLELPKRTAVPVGGGKDSLVTIELLRQSKVPIELVSVNSPDPIKNCCTVSKLPWRIFGRTIDPCLIELNQNGAYNGHIPITAIFSLIFACGAILHGYDTVAFSNERSAEEPNIEVDGKVFNHQFSKTLAFENTLAKLLGHHGIDDLKIFSFLRPLSELHISQLFCRSERYDQVFTSCNKSFRIDKTRVPNDRWCGYCPKCQFVFLVLATAMPKDRLLNIFKINLLADPKQLKSYEELLGISGHKPWECVGLYSEVSASFQILAQHPNWQEEFIVKQLKDKLPTEPHASRCLTPIYVNNMPSRFEKILQEAL